METNLFAQAVQSVEDLSAQGKHDEAAKLASYTFERALSISGIPDQDTLSNLVRLAQFFFDQGLINQARQLALLLTSFYQTNYPQEIMPRSLRSLQAFLIMMPEETTNEEAAKAAAAEAEEADGDDDWLSDDADGTVSHGIPIARPGNSSDLEEEDAFWAGEIPEFSVNMRGDFAESVPPDPEPVVAGSKSLSVEPAPAKTLTRYPAIDCPDQAVLNERFSLFVQLLIFAPTPSAAAIKITDVTDPEKLPEIELVLRAPGFELVGSNSRILQIDRLDDSEELFTLIPRQVGEQVIRVDFYQHGRRLGTERRTVLVREAGAQPRAFAPARVEPDPEPVLLDFTANPTIPPADLEIVVQVNRHNPRNLTFELHSTREDVGYHRMDAGECDLSGLPLERMQAFYKEVSQLTRSQSRHFGSFGEPNEPAVDQSESVRRLARLGNQLWDELIPEKLKTEYWKFKGKVTSVLITSDEPWVPWEMIKPYRFDEDEQPLDEPFWCQQFAISRWLSGQGPADLLKMDSARSIAPSQIDLPAVVEEIAFLGGLSTLRPSLRLLEPLHALAEVRQWLETGDFSVLHFACHGMFDALQPMNSGIMLSGGALRPSDLLVRFGGKRARPLIFINACHGGRIEQSFTGLGGWATKLVEARVGAFVGALWEVDDSLALSFARSFYTSLLRDNKPLAEAFRLAREEIRQAAPHNSTWLAYVLYSDPECRVLSA